MELRRQAFVAMLTVVCESELHQFRGGGIILLEIQQKNAPNGSWFAALNRARKPMSNGSFLPPHTPPTGFRLHFSASFIGAEKQLTIICHLSFVIGFGST
jgi:hypothetical protein